jgi:hypothetical protein
LCDPKEELIGRWTAIVDFFWDHYVFSAHFFQYWNSKDLDWHTSSPLA